MSGTGTNLRKILELQNKLIKCPFKVVVIFTDTKDEQKCNAVKIGDDFNVPVIINDIMDYYRERGYNDKRDMKVREQFDSETKIELEKRNVSMVALCGYMSLVTSPIYDNFTTINVHPADLTKKDRNGKRIYAGCLGAGCIKKAIQNRETEVRSTVHLVNGELDGGPVISVSPAIEINPDVPDEKLDEIAHEYQERLKERGDWVIYPETINMISNGRMRIDSNKLYVDGVASDAYRF